MKLNLINSIRRLLKIEADSRTYFTKEEIEAIVAQVSPSTNFNTLEYKVALSTTVDGWNQQKTIETHPTIENLNVIYDLLRNRSYRLETLIQLLDEELLSMSKAIRLEDNVLTVELK